ncbi:hypothetical protein TNCV_1056401 [Trichonephila clavipes]|nr:hypothetical protein TNCV_1056401 [Trichonephila clavipes]
MRGQLLERSKKGEKITDVAREFDIAHGVCFTATMEEQAPTAQRVANQFFAASGKQISQKTVARRLRRRTYAPDLLCVGDQTAPCCRCNGVVSITIGLNRTGHAYYSQDEVEFSLSLDCRRQLIWRKSGTAYRQKISGKRTDIRHAVSWCGPAS